MVLLKQIFLLIFLTTISYYIQGQPVGPSETLLVGQPLPNIALNHIQHFSRASANTRDFKGKWLILDFWSRGCTVCVQAFPHINRHQQEHSDSLQVFLIGRTEPHIEDMYEKFRKKENLILPILYDSFLFNRFAVWTVPYTVVVDPLGIIRAITYTLADSTLTALLSGQNPPMQLALNYYQRLNELKTYDFNKPMLVDGNGGPDSSFLYRSILARWTSNQPSLYPNFPPINEKYIQTTGQTIVDLYQVAYGDSLSNVPFPPDKNAYGKYWWRPILEIRDSIEASRMNDEIPPNLYSYCQSFPVGKGKFNLIQKTMRDDLDHYFGYTVHVETRVMPCWKLINLRPKDKRPLQNEADVDDMEIDSYSGSLQTLIGQIWYHNPKELFFDETELPKKTQIDLDVIFSDKKELREALQKIGLDLVPCEKPVKVIIISDRAS